MRAALGDHTISEWCCYSGRPDRWMWLTTSSLGASAPSQFRCFFVTEPQGFPAAARFSAEHRRVRLHLASCSCSPRSWNPGTCGWGLLRWMSGVGPPSLVPKGRECFPSRMSRVRIPSPAPNSPPLPRHQALPRLRSNRRRGRDILRPRQTLLVDDVLRPRQTGSHKPPTPVRQ